MSMLTEDMKRIIEEQRLGFVATVGVDGTPNLSPKGTTAVWDDDHLVFADIRSPQTILNLQHNPALEINVVDPVARRGYRFKGRGIVLTEGPLYERGCAFYTHRGVTHSIQAIVLVTVDRALPVLSPVYDQGLTEAEVRQRWQQGGGS